MTPRLLSALAAASVVAAIAAGYAVSLERGFETASVNTQVFPELRAQLNDVTQLKLVTHQRQMTLIRKDSGWQMLESDGYPGQVKNIQKVLIGLADLVYAEPKTQKPELYAKLDLRDPAIEGARSRHVSVLGADGKLLADVILGKTRYNMPGTTRDGIYLRFPDQSQSWLAIGQLEASRLPGDWLQSDIVDIEGKSIQQASFRHPDGETLTVRKSAEKNGAFELSDLPADKKLKFATDPENMATVLEKLELDDARQARHFDFSPASSVTAQFLTDDGLQVDVDMIERKADAPAADTDEAGEETEYWIRLTATADDAAVTARAKQITEKTQGWAYKIPAYKASRLNKRLNEIITDKEAGS